MTSTILRRLSGLVFALISARWLTSCIIPVTQTTPDLAKRGGFEPPSGSPRKLILFYDGTSNTWTTRTNVRRLFEMIAAREDPSVVCWWCEGVGASGARTTQTIGSALGIGMKERILRGYEFLSRNYRQGDEVYVFGFSRGAHTARTLCGVLAHCGLYDGREADKAIPLKKIWNFCLKAPQPRDAISNPALIEQILQDNRKKLARELNLPAPMTDMPIRFLGLWDTVPGTNFTKIAEDGSEEGRDGVGEPERYKILPYPNIRFAAQALSLDERRSKFKPVYLGGPLVPSKTRTLDVWFPGAHSDVGGGYEDSNDMAGVSLNWMLGLLEPEGLLKPGTRVHENALGVAHSPIFVWPNNIGSDDVPRRLPAGSILHPSVSQRVAAGPMQSSPPSKGGKGYSSREYKPQVRLVKNQKDEGVIADFKTITANTSEWSPGRTSYGNQKPLEVVNAVAADP